MDNTISSLASKSLPYQVNEKNSFPPSSYIYIFLREATRSTCFRLVAFITPLPLPRMWHLPTQPPSSADMRCKHRLQAPGQDMQCGAQHNAGCSLASSATPTVGVSHNILAGSFDRVSPSALGWDCGSAEPLTMFPAPTSDPRQPSPSSIEPANSGFPAPNFRHSKTVVIGATDCCTPFHDRFLPHSSFTLVTSPIINHVRSSDRYGLPTPIPSLSVQL